MNAQRAAGRMWWACDHGHANAIDADAPSVYWAACGTCRTPAELYRVEVDVAEDDPTRLVPGPTTDPSPELPGQLDIFGGVVL